MPLKLDISLLICLLLIYAVSLAPSVGLAKHFVRITGHETKVRAMGILILDLQNLEIVTLFAFRFLPREVLKSGEKSLCLNYYIIGTTIECPE